MTGIIVQLALSWLLVWLFERKDLGVLGFRPTGRRLTGFAIFFTVTAMCCASGFLLRMFVAREQWELNPALNANLILSGTWWHLRSVLFEELIFRGVLLYILIKRIGMYKAIIVSAAAFGIYHWFSFSIIGDPVKMAIIFIVTGAMGFVLAYAYAKTRSLYIPCAIHFGWNFTQGFIFPEGAIGVGIFKATGPQPLVTVSYLLYFIVIFGPMLSSLAINFFLLKHSIRRAAITPHTSQVSARPERLSDLQK